MTGKRLLPLIIVLGLLTGCVEVALPAEEPAPATEAGPAATTAATPAAAADIPDISAEEMAASLWNKLPEKLPDGYTKSQFLSATGNATYLGDKEWSYRLSGSGSRSKSLPQSYEEKTPGRWYLTRSKEVTTYSLELTAGYYEKTGTLDIRDIRQFGEKTAVEVVDEEPVLGYGLRVERISATEMPGNILRVQGTATNIGCQPLEGAIIQVASFDLEDNLLQLDSGPLTPEIIEPGAKGNFLVDIKQEAPGSAEVIGGEYITGYFDYRFLLPSEEEIYFEPPD